MIGRSIFSAGMTTRVATAVVWADGDGPTDGEPDGGTDESGRVAVGLGSPPMTIGVSSGGGVGSTAPVYVSRPPAISETPVAVSNAGRRRFRRARPSVLTG